MKKPISSAGLVYVYLNGYEENGILNIQTIDSYRHMESGFYLHAMENAALADENDNMVHLFMVLGTAKKATAVHCVIEDELEKNSECIENGKIIHNVSRMLDGIGNSFCECIQEFFCTRHGLSLKKIYKYCGKFVVVGLCCSRLPDTPGDAVTNGILSLWIKREEPCLCGNQIMLRSFFTRDFVGRKVVACIPQRQTGEWSLIFEGGHALSLDQNFSYSKETMNPNALGAFCLSNLQTLMFNPIYAYGIWLQPNDLCEEWHKVFIYLCACAENTWDEENISSIYARFLTFLQENICEITEVEPILSKQIYHAALRKHIERFRSFLKGEDEPVLSKDLHQTLNSRYVYLQYIWSLVTHKVTYNDFSCTVLHDIVQKAVRSENTYEKGTLWEDAAAYVLKAIPAWKITGRRIQADAEEIDISVVNISLDDELWQLGAYVLVECKNWRMHVDLHQIRNIAHISNRKGNKTAILFAANGITRDALEEIVRLAAENLSIICITAKDLMGITDLMGCRDLILEKWKQLQDMVDFTTMI